MDHEHSHEYMHAHGIPHDHQAQAEADLRSGQPAHEEAHGHPHGHEQAQGCSAGAGCDSDCARCDADPRAEVVALMRYMVDHNAAHAHELAQLAGRLNALGDVDAFEQVMKAVADFEKGNMRLSAVLAALNPPKQ